MHLEQVECILNLLAFSTSAKIEFIPELELARVTGVGVADVVLEEGGGRRGVVVDENLDWTLTIFSGSIRRGINSLSSLEFSNTGVRHIVGNPSSGSSGGDGVGGITFGLLMVQKKGTTLGLADFEWMYLRD
jgi:hypothetical protein